MARYDFMHDMERARLKACDRRNSGRHNGKSAKGWQHKRGDYAPDPEDGSWDRARAIAKAAWQCANGDAIEAYRFAVYGEQWEGL